MPAFLKTPEDERLWSKAKALAKEQGHAENWAYITGIWKRMKGKEANMGPSATRIAGRYLRAYDEVGRSPDPNIGWQHGTVEPFEQGAGEGSQMPPARDHGGEVLPEPDLPAMDIPGYGKMSPPPRVPKVASDPKTEILRHMMTLFDAAERAFGRDAVLGAFQGATTNAFRSSFGSKPGFSDLKKLQGLLVWAMADAANDVNTGITSEDPRGQFQRGDGKRVLGLPRLDVSPDAAAWFGDLRDAVQFSLARAVLAAKAKQYGADLDRSKTIYASAQDELWAVVWYEERGIPGWQNDLVGPAPDTATLRKMVRDENAIAMRKRTRTEFYRGHSEAMKGMNRGYPSHARLASEP